MLNALNEMTKKQICDHALAQYPKESCGLIINLSGKPRFKPCKNISEDNRNFVLDPEDYVRCELEGDIIAVVHSHCDISPNPSQADLVGCEKTGVPWIILSVPSMSWRCVQPSGYQAPLIGRCFVHGVLDCYSLVRDWYRQEMKINLPDFNREDFWWQKGQNLYLENFEKVGFKKIEGPLQTGDAILMQISSPVPNHAAIYLGRDKIIHHVQNRLSCRDIYGGFWKKNTSMFLRYGAAA